MSTLNMILILQYIQVLLLYWSSCSRLLKNATDLLSHRLEWIAFNITSNNGTLFQMAISLHCMKSQLPFDKTFSMAYVAQTGHKVSN